MAIIAISGYAGAGKDTAGQLIQTLDPDHSWKIKKFADKLRQVAALFLGLPVAYLYTDEFKKSVLSPEWNYLKQMFENDEHRNEVSQQMTGREFLQKLGTDAVREGLHKNAWVNSLMVDYPGKQTHWKYAKNPNWVITDMRFPNEVSAVKERDGTTIRLHRWPVWFEMEQPMYYMDFLPDDLKTIDRRAYAKWDSWRKSLHESETSLDDHRFDFVINNNGSIEDLRHNLLTIINPTNHERKTSVYQTQDN